MGDYSLLKEADAVVVEAPSLEAMDARGEPWAAILAPHDGLLVREKLFLSQVLCPLCEKQLRFNAGPWARDMPARLGCLLYTSPSPRDGLLSRMPSSA